MKSVALLDANVLYPQSLRDLFLSLAECKLYQPKWSPFIMEEWVRNVLMDNPQIEPARLDRTCHLMNVHFPDAIINGYEARIDELWLPDPGDRHVLAAALHSGTNLIVTFNLRDFPEHILKPFGIRVVHPDHFLIDLCRRNMPTVCDSVAKMRSRLKNPIVSVELLLDSFDRAGLPLIAARLSKFTDRL